MIKRSKNNLVYIGLLLGILFLISACEKNKINDQSHDHEHETDHETETELGVDNNDDHISVNEIVDTVHISDESVRLAKIKKEKVELRNLERKTTLLGEIGFNEDNFVTISPRFPGIVKKVLKNVGDSVKEGEVLAIIESNESLSNYNVISLISGQIIYKQLSLGEILTPDKVIYKIANLNDVWANFNVFEKDLNYIKKGQKILIRSNDNQKERMGIISYISPYLDKKNRTAIAKVVLDNKDHIWKPAIFVNGIIQSNIYKNKLPVIKLKAIQSINSIQKVFVPINNNEFKAIEIIIGEADGDYVHVKRGLKLNDEYVIEGSFELKSKLITEGLSEHAGHGH
ncbi:MAG: efflux RND transporter periplasmic adaptor subunit [Pseudomonadota bacterium]